MFEVPYGQDPYSAIGRYIRENITAIEDIIAVIDINGVETNELFLVDMQEDGYFVWESDWYEGEQNIALIDFFPVSEAINSSVQPDVPDTNVGDTISRQAAINALCKSGCDSTYCGVSCPDVMAIENLPSAQPEPHWTPCSEHTPDTPVRVQVQLKNEWIITAWYEEGDWYSVPMLYDGDDCWVTLDDVVAWMPLPEPWRGEES